DEAHGRMGGAAEEAADERGVGGVEVAAGESDGGVTLAPAVVRRGGGEGQRHYARLYCPGHGAKAPPPRVGSGSRPGRPSGGEPGSTFGGRAGSRWWFGTL